ncbi:BPTI/Kunitz domain-containing protein-like [Crotalus tigris]|uniref:BPTI/Kunitz domain-containing protein-like n=1 Tax=Crotalus tigris TaxID=88082 RepID=UPI00192F80FB|nr:BPTI/Kunitz domain-containing protein-like [Crotalus tigris]
MFLIFGLLIFCFLYTGISLDICQLPKDVGWCKASFQHFYFNAATEKCESFIYGGCEGNQNNFPTLHQCKARCEKSASSKTNAAICKLRLKKGPCKSVLIRFYFNKRTGRCEYFIYGGCKGNKNNFLTWTECMMKCQHYGNLFPVLSDKPS